MAIITLCPRCQTSIQVAEEHSNPHERFRCPKCRDIFLLHEALDILAESPPEARPVALEGAASAPSAAAPSVPAAALAGSVPPPVPAATTPQDAPTDEYLDDSDFDEDYEEPVSEPSRPVRRPAREGSMFGQMTGIVLGGVAGLYVGAMVLNYMNIPLPDVARNLPGLSKPAPAPANPVADKADPEPAKKIEPVTPPPEPKTVTPEPKVVETPSKKSETPPVAKKEPPPPPELPVKGAVSYTPDQLGAALGDAHKAAGGGIGKTNVVASIDPAAYEKLCELAERVTFVVPTPGDTSLENRRRGAGDVMKRVAGTQDNLIKLGQQALQKFSGEPIPPGIALAGVIQSVDQRGKLWALDVMLYGGAKRVIVMSPVLNNMKPGDKRVILGVVVDDPAANLTGFSGAEKRVIWCGLPVDIPASTFR